MFFLGGVVESIFFGKLRVGWGVIILLYHIGPVYNTANLFSVRKYKKTDINN